MRERSPQVNDIDQIFTVIIEGNFPRLREDKPYLDRYKKHIEHQIDKIRRGNPHDIEPQRLLGNWMTIFKTPMYYEGRRRKK